MTEHTVQVQLQYRPGPDVLAGQLHLPGAEDAPHTRQTPDADTVLEWAQLADGPHLSSFHIIHAAARLESGPLPLPESLDRPVRRLLHAAQQAISGVTDPLTRVTSRAAASASVPLSGVHAHRLPAPPGAAARDAPMAAELALQLRHIADEVRTWSPAGDSNEAVHTDELTSLLRELSSTIGSSRGLTSPGTRAAVQRALERSRHLPDDRYELLARGLRDLDDQRSWRRALESFEAATHQRGRHPAR